MDQAQSNDMSQEALDNKISKNIQEREMQKLNKTFYESLESYYSSRKYKEQVTLGCAQHCLQTYREDDLTRAENKCMHQCFHKYYRYLAYSNTLYQYLIADQDMDKQITESVMDEGEQELDHSQAFMAR